jgi:lipoyl(octanoyl) transferase
MILYRWGLVEYGVAYAAMKRVHAQAVQDGENHLILCSHPSVFTVGSDDKGQWSVPTVRTDRGGSITCHSEGQAVAYFCFQAFEPPLFYRRVRGAYEDLFAMLLPKVYYDKERPGFYLENRKVASLGFRYRLGVSLHGVALNVDVDLAFHAQVNPCNLEGVVPTSLVEEGVGVSSDEVNEKIIEVVRQRFHENVEESLLR